MATIADVARRAQVSTGVVSRVLNEDPTLRISEPTRERVLAVVRELDYVPSRAARSLRMTLPSTITLALPDVTSSVHSEFVVGVEEVARERDLSVVLTRAEQVLEDPRWLDRLAREGRTDGVILHSPPDLFGDLLRERVQQIAAPLVLVNGDAESAGRTVIYDDESASALAVRHLVELGHHDLGFIGGVPGGGPADRRLAGFRSACDNARVQSRADWVTDLGFTGENGRAAARRLMGLAVRPTAVVIANINAAMGFLAELHQLGVDIPGELSTVAIHDVWYADAIWPPISTVRMPSKELGRAALRTLFEPVSDSGIHVRVSNPAPELIERASSQRLA